MNSEMSERFRRMLGELPEDVRRQAREAFRLFTKDPRHPSLHFKKVSKTKPIYSARIDLEYRVVGVLEGMDIVWFWIGPHTEYERLLHRL